MIKSWTRIGGTVAAAALVATAGVSLPAGAAPTTAPQAAKAKVHFAKLYTMKTTTGGFFYSASKKEVRSAAQKNKFKLVHVDLGELRTKGKGTRPLYRLRVKQGSNYIVSISKKEVKRLRAAGWVYEGILGYGYKNHHRNTVHLWRLTNGKTWQLAKTSRAKYLRHHGWKLDGPVAWARK